MEGSLANTVDTVSQSTVETQLSSSSGPLEFFGESIFPSDVNFWV